MYIQDLKNKRRNKEELLKETVMRGAGQQRERLMVRSGV